MIRQTGTQDDGLALSPLKRERLIYAAPMLTAHDVGVLLAIEHHMPTADGTAWPSQSRLADMLRVSTKTIKRAVRHLRSLGYISTETGRRGVLVYRINWTNIESACRANQDQGLTVPSAGTDSPLTRDSQSHDQGPLVPLNRKKNDEKKRRVNYAHTREKSSDEETDREQRASGIIRAPAGKYASVRTHRASG